LEHAPDISQLDSDAMLVHVIDGQSTPIGLVNQRFARFRNGSEARLCALTGIDPRKAAIP
jgi:hypothetical protein